MMADLRNIMSGIITKAQDWEILPDTCANPIRRVPRETAPQIARPRGGDHE
jgi:hypothetical protein